MRAIAAPYPLDRKTGLRIYSSRASVVVKHRKLTWRSPMPKRIQIVARIEPDLRKHETPTVGRS